MKTDPIPLEDAQSLYKAVMARLGPGTFRDSPTGSLRRCEPLVGDLDIQVETKRLALPYLKSQVFDLGELVRGADRLQVVRNVLGSGIQLELSMVYAPRNWYAMLAIRTGPAEMEQWMRKRLTFLDVPRPHGEIKADSEEDFFERVLEIEYVAPEDRAAWLKERKEHELHSQHT